MPWSILASWLTVGIVVPVLIGIGVGVMSMTPPDFVTAKISFSVAAFVLASRVMWWLAVERPAESRAAAAVLFAFVILGGIGAICLSSLLWVDARRGLLQSSVQVRSETTVPTAAGVAAEAAKTLPSASNRRSPTPPQPVPAKKEAVEELKVFYTASPVMTESRKTRITDHLSRFRAYLVSLRIDVPLAVPPISIGSRTVLTKPLELTGPAGAEDSTFFLPSGGRYEARFYPGQKPSTDFNQNIVLMDSEIDDLAAIASIYGMYALSQLLDRVGSNPDDFYWQARFMAITNGAAYFGSSFCDAKIRYGAICEAFWEIRERLGQKHADQLVAYSIRAFNESIHRSVKTDLSAYFYARLKDGAEISDDGASIPTVTDIWLKHGLQVDGPYTP